MPGLGCANLGGVQDTLQERNTLTQADKANHDGDDDGQQTNDFVQDTANHLSGNNAMQDTSCGSFHLCTSLKENSEKFITKVAETHDCEEEGNAGEQIQEVFHVTGILHDLDEDGHIVDSLNDFYYLGNGFGGGFYDLRYSFSGNGFG